MTGPNAEDGYGADVHLHHVLPATAVPARNEVVLSIVAHLDRGDGFCDVCGERDPCEERGYWETVLSRMNAGLR